MTQSNNNLKQASPNRRPMSLKSSVLQNMMPSSDLLPRRAPPKNDSPQERSAFVIGILDEVLDILNDDIFDDEDDLVFDTKSNRRLSQ
ncbi:unnamed protein product [Cylindrotheca closterium]|uniref:Uncharacterized protein n=1 Tax=Cylindrotheca closterium TaxID=2856 RepID=A0AAD2G311_9STRA|nr:unnamed protein product [Cylindrotheca closterium]